MDSFFRVIPATPRVKEGEVVSDTSQIEEAGNFSFVIMGLILYNIKSG